MTDIALSHEEAANDRVMFGFWVYLMTDLLMFSVLFAVYAVLHQNTVHGPTGRQLFELPVALKETLILLTSSFTCGLGMLAARKDNKSQTLLWFGITFALGLAFLTFEMRRIQLIYRSGSNIAHQRISILILRARWHPWAAYYLWVTMDGDYYGIHH